MHGLQRRQRSLWEEQLAGWTHPRMTRKLLYVTVVVALAIVAVVAFALPAGAQQRTFRVKLSDGSIIPVPVDAACVGIPPGLPGTPVSELPGACVGGGSKPPPPPTSAPTTPT